jgi:predicted ATPase
MIRKLHAKNFKSWQDTGDIRLAPITAFFGPNSSGKTSLLQLVLMLKQTAESPDRGLIVSFGGPRSLVDLGDFGTLIYKHDIQKALELTVQWDVAENLQIGNMLVDTNAFVINKTTLTFNTKVGIKPTVGSPATSFAVEEMSYEIAGHKFLMKRRQEKPGYELAHSGPDFRFVREKGRAWDLPDPVKFYGFPDQVRAYFQNAGFLSDFEFQFEKMLANVYYLGPLRAYPERQYTWSGGQPADMGRTGEQAVAALLASRDRGETISQGRGIKRVTVEEYVASWLKNLGLIHSFSVKHLAPGSNIFEVRVKKSATSPEVLITDVGFGVSQILPVLVLCFYAPEGATIILEQPEIHLHPAVQAGLADVLLDAVEKRAIQVILESHSEHLLRRFQRRVAESVVQNDTIALYFCDQDAQGSRLTPLQLDVLGTISNWPKDFFGDEMGELSKMAKAAIRKKQLLQQ